jgi:hypothetical protein
MDERSEVRKLQDAALAGLTRRPLSEMTRAEAVRALRALAAHEAAVLRGMEAAE